MAVFVSVSACEEPPADLREWTVEDHDHQTATRKGRTPTADGVLPKDSRSLPSQRNVLVEVTWTKQCANCHGRFGRGDGPQSTMVKARDLSLPEWQASVSDEAMAKVIREGKDKMPAFNLPDSLIAELVEHIRGMERKPKGAHGEEEQREAAQPEARATAPASATTPPNAPASSPPSSPPPDKPSQHGAVPAAAAAPGP